MTLAILLVMSEAGWTILIVYFITSKSNQPRLLQLNSFIYDTQ